MCNTCGCRAGKKSKAKPTKSKKNPGKKKQLFTAESAELKIFEYDIQKIDIVGNSFDIRVGAHIPKLVAIT